MYTSPSSDPAATPTNPTNGTTRDEPTITIQYATPADAAAIARIGHATFHASFAHSMDAKDMQIYLETSYSTEAIVQNLADSVNTFIVARQQQQIAEHDAASVTQSNTEVIGFLQLKRNTTEPCLPTALSLIELNRIYMSTSSYSRGTGKLLMEAGLRIAKEQGFEGVWLGVWEENHRARRFYQRFGFEKVGVHDFKMGERIDTDDVMLLRI